jgi:hypothetical protein
MKSKEEKDQAYAELSMPEVSTLKDIQKELETFVDKHTEISIEGLRVLSSIQKSIDIVKDKYFDKVIHLLKQGYELD